MADTVGFTSYDSLLATTLNNYRTTLENNVFQARPMLNWLKSKNRIKTYNGGARIVIPIIDGTNSTAGTYSMYDTLPTTPQDGMTAAEYLWKQAAVSIAIAGLEEAQNNGKEAIIDLLEAKIMQAEESLSDLMTKQFLGNGVAANSWNGLANIVDDDATTSYKVGGLDSASHTTWKAYCDKAANDTPLTIADMSKAWNGTAQGGPDTPDFILTTQALWEKYESLLQPQLRYSDPATADAGFVNLLYRGAPVVWDVAVGETTNYQIAGNTNDSKVMYFLNSKYLWIARHSQKWFTNTSFQRPTNQDARYAQILAYGQLVTNCRRRLGKITKRTA